MTTVAGKDAVVPTPTPLRSVCVITREFPPDTSYGGIARVAHMQARALVDAGVAVHVISLAPDGATRTVLDDGIVVHRIAQPHLQLPADMGYVVAGAWSHAVNERFAQLDALVRFDAVLAQDYHAETLHLARRPELPLVVTLHAPMKVVNVGSGRATTPGQSAFAELEGVALRSADLLLHPTEFVLEGTRLAFGGDLPPVALCPFPLDLARFAVPGRKPWREGVLRVLYVGRLEPLKGPDLALRAVAAARARGVDARITLVGRDVAQSDGSSYRRGVLVPLMAELGLDFGDVRFVEQLAEAGIAQHLRHADVALLPSRIENFHTAAVEALAAGIPVITGARNGLACWVTPEDGLRTLPADDAAVFAAAAAAALADAAWLGTAGARGAACVSEAFEPAAATARLVELVAGAVATKAAAASAAASGAAPAPSPAPAPDPAAPAAPELAIVVLAHNALAYTQRCLRSIVAHTDTAFRVYLVDNASSDGTAAWCAALDPRITVIRSDVNLGVSGGRNAGLAAIEGEPGHIVFLDNDVEVLAGWWRPFHEALLDRPDAGIAGERGVRITVLADSREIEPLADTRVVGCDMVIGFCMFMRAAAVRTIGRFDENMSLFWHDDDDYGMRARRLGWAVLHVPSQRVLHFEHKSSKLVDGIWAAPETPTEMSDRNQAYLAAKWQAQAEAAGATILAHAGELVETPELLRAYTRAVAPGDAATLVIYAPGWDAEELGPALAPALAAAGLDGDEATGHELIALAVPHDAATEIEIAHRIDAVLTQRSPAGTFAALPHADPGDLPLLAEIVARRARSRRSHVLIAAA